MSVSVTVLDYGIGNLLNVVRALEHCGATTKVITSAAEAPAQSAYMVMPGVGAFGDGMAEIRARGFDHLVRQHAATGRPYLGICVGMQVMFDASEEMGEHQGMGLIPGKVLAVPERGLDGQKHRIPHIGWRALEPVQTWSGTMLTGAQRGDRVYFVHSFAAVPQEPAITLAQVSYDGIPICAAVRKDNLYGTQFHPERSGDVGLGMLAQFLQL